jgi:hypothetical protein
MRRAFGMSDWDKRPTLLYFHYPHEEKPQVALASGAASKKQCKNLNDETVARWSTLFHCVEVDMSSSHAKLLEKFGAGEQPSFAIVTKDLKVVAKSAVVNKKGFVALLKKVAPEFKSYWKNVQERIKLQKTKLADARKLAKSGSEEKALLRYREIREDGVRIAKSWEPARAAAEKLEAKLLK